MNPTEMQHLQHPIGKFEYGKTYSFDDTKNHIENLRVFPHDLMKVAAILKAKDLDKTYRPDGWSIKQLIHHIGESHMNCYIRLKLALTEDSPVIKPYLEDLWVKTEENNLLGPAVSLTLIEAIHIKLVTLLQTMQEADFNRTYIHPQYNRTFTIAEMLALYSWHGKHHLAHINLALGN